MLGEKFNLHQAEIPVMLEQGLAYMTMDARPNGQKEVRPVCRHWLVFLGLLLSCQPASASEFCKAYISETAPNLGDPLVYTIEVMTSGETQYSPDITPPQLKRYFQVGETFTRSSVSILNGQTHIITFKEIHLMANRTGEIQIEPARVELVDSASKQRVVRQTNSVTLAVNEATGGAALPTPTPEIDVLKPIKKSAKLSLGQWLPFAVGGGIILGMFGMMFYLKHRPEPAPRASEEPVDTRTPEQRAFDALEEAMQLKAEGRVNEFYTVLSSILRRYMAESFGFKAEEATTREMLSEMERMKFKPNFLEKYRGYFLECDRVKYANLTPLEQELEAAAPRVKELIQHQDKRELTVPPPPGAEGAGGEGNAPEAEMALAAEGSETEKPAEKS
ncbi:hypothetical protein JW933_00180 [candidate division FCPU426 bacterium]|nr:hypothetical protein [candidate division FCPU426 bacterium]